MKHLTSLFLLLALPAPLAAQDCNLNGVDDALDLALGTSGDCDRNGVPDECEPCGFAATLLDFEGFAELTELDDEYAAQGVTFLPAGPELLLPIVALESGATSAFSTSAAAKDKPLVGVGGLTDAIPAGGDYRVPVPIEMHFDPPVVGAALRVFDVDDQEQVLIELFDDVGLLASLTLAAGDPGTGDGIGKYVQFAPPTGSAATGARITTFDPDGMVDFAIDSLTLTRPAAGGCGQLVRVSQESAPGVGDFEDHVLGTLHPFANSGSAESLYAYDYPWKESFNGGLVQLADKQSNLFLVESNEGLLLFIVHDRPGDGSGGQARVRVDVDDFLTAPDLLVGDDPGSDSYAIGATNGVVTGTWDWNSCCTDGMVVGPLTGPWSASVQFQLTINGLDTWVAAGAGGTELELALGIDRRVRLELLAAPGSCAAPLTTDRIEASLAAGSVTSFALNAGLEHAGELYVLVGSATGSAPGFVLDGVLVPLQPDAYMALTFEFANQAPFGATLGLLDPAGAGAASLTFPAGLDPSLAGLTLHHAWLSLSLTEVVFTAASNAVPLALLP